MSDIRIAIAGAAGRMGRELVRAVAQAKGCRLAAAIEAERHPELGVDAGVLAGLAPLGVKVDADASTQLSRADVVIDFTVPKASLALAAHVAASGIGYVIGTTGFSADEEGGIRDAARHAAIVKSGNMSIGVALLASLVERAARTLDDFDIGIFEMHHGKKLDSPSGTAQLLSAAAKRGRLSEGKSGARDGRAEFVARDGVAIASLRGGTVVGEHQVIFSGDGERIVLSHTADDRAIFARGAVIAAVWTRGKKAGLYTAADVFDLRN